ILLLQEFDIEIRNKKGAENLAANYLSWLENPDLEKLTIAEIRDLFPEEQLMTISDKGNEPWYAYYANYLASRTKSYEGVLLEIRQRKSFDNVIVARQEGIMVSPQLQGKSVKPNSTSLISSTMHANWSELVMHVNEPTTILQGMRHPKSTSKKAKVKVVWIVFNKQGHEAIKLYNEDGSEFIVNKKRVKPYQKDALNVGKDDDITLDDEGGVMKAKVKVVWIVFNKQGHEAIKLYNEDGSEFIVNKKRVKPYQKDALNVGKDDDITLDDEGGVT
nr:reverse transcriptase domain-containing protein [Tanacetum cinerariifolium]